jgi:hypothetical protein
MRPYTTALYRLSARAVAAAFLSGGTGDSAACSAALARGLLDAGGTFPACCSPGSGGDTPSSGRLAPDAWRSDMPSSTVGTSLMLYARLMLCMVSSKDGLYVLAGAILFGRRNRLAPERGPPLHSTSVQSMHAQHRRAASDIEQSRIAMIVPGAANKEGVIRRRSADAVCIGQCCEAVSAASGVGHVDVRFLAMAARQQCRREAAGRTVRNALGQRA